jgi:hypothetical protein
VVVCLATDFSDSLNRTVYASPPKAIIKLMLYGYSKGVKSSRGDMGVKPEQRDGQGSDRVYGNPLNNDSGFYFGKQ